MKKTLILTAFTMAMGMYGQNNLLDTSTWTVGSGSVTGFPQYGSATENVRELDVDPFGNQSVIWKGIPQTPTSSGGWQTDPFAIDHTKTYRFTVWMKKSNAATGYEVFATEAYDSNGDDSIVMLDGNASNNPIFKSSILQLDQWYLYVCFVHQSGYTGTSNIGRVYDSSGASVAVTTDFKWGATSVTSKHRAYYWQGENALDVLSFYGPTVYEVNGQEPTISELLNPSGGSDIQPPTIPTNLSSSGTTDTTTSLSWTASGDNVGVTNYKIFKDGNLEATLGNVTTYQVTGLTASTTYAFTVSALDAAGNESAQGTAVSVTTSASSGGGGSSVWTESGSTVSYSGNVAIGTSSVPSDYKLAVEGKIRTREIRVDQDTWPDYVFKEDYDLPTLEEIERYIEEKGHLPNIPSAKEVETNGIELGEMDKLLLEKIEELTLHTIGLQKLLKKQQKLIELQQRQIQNLQN